ncbi:MAG TPA: peptide chain release factor N(5)-glutamine methyltransferase [Candidatus Acidoferrales bacterium]|nr:peptide chain release factor N(5)-glutamine methyltransferase [Candidatus Acidoferrales bacterium]
MPSLSPRTIAEAIEASRHRLRSVSRTPWLDARLLAQYVTGLDASAVVAYGETSIDARRRTRLFELVERRAGGEPVAYIIGHKSFCGLEIAVDRRALVPRPETEELVLACVDDWGGQGPAIAEIGTGSGAIACALAHLIPRAQITASDVSAETLELAAHNVTELGFSEQVTLVHGSLFMQFPDDARFDVIIANLPYVGTDNLDELQDGVRDYEPAEALMAGSDGLDVYRPLVMQAPDRLRSGGALYFECAPHNADSLRALVAAAFAHAQTEIKKDAAGLERMVISRSARTS